MSPAKPVEPPTTILIVGGGVYGLSTALHLAAGPYKNNANLITVVDRSGSPPNSDAACFDINKVIRADYPDSFYATRALDAIKKWRSPGWNKSFYESGVFLCEASSGSVVRDIYDTVTQSGMQCKWFDGVHSFPEAPVVMPKDAVAYLNYTGGWAFSLKAVLDLRDACKELGVQFKQGNAAQLVIENDDAVGIKLHDGSQVRGDITVLCTGSWTSQLYPKYKEILLPTAHSVATVKLTDNELAQFRNVPVVSYKETGFYIFPPNPQGYIKMAIHGRNGYVNPTPTLPSIPSAVEAKCEVPDDAIQALRNNLAIVYPTLKDHPFEQARICWYCDTASEDWLLDYDDDFPSLFVASGDSGHAFKFLPTIGEYIVKGLERRFTEEEQAHWGLSKHVKEAGLASSVARPSLSTCKKKFVHRSRDWPVMLYIAMPACLLG